MKLQKVVGDFLIYDSIGKGQFGQVHIAKKKNSNPDDSNDAYACKVLSLEKANTPKKMAEIEKEVEILSNLNHPNIIKLHTSLKTKNNLYLFFELCDIGDLKTFVKKGSSLQPPRLPEREAKYIMTQIVGGMQYLNSKKVVHRDLKLENILVKRLKPRSVRANAENQIEEFEFKVADLGLAKIINSDNEMIQTFCGTPLCMAPEIINGENYSYKVDVWSLGALLFQLLTGTYPFVGYDLQNLRQNLRAGAYKIPRDVMISMECLDFLNSCLRFDSYKRGTLDTLLNHPFLQPFQRLESVRESKILEKTFGIARQSIVMNTRNSYSFYEMYNNYLIKKIDKRIDRIKEQQHQPNPVLDPEVQNPPEKIVQQGNNTNVNVQQQLGLPKQRLVINHQNQQQQVKQVGTEQQCKKKVQFENEVNKQSTWNTIYNSIFGALLIISVMMYHSL